MTAPSWPERSQRSLGKRLRVVRAALEAYVKSLEGSAPGETPLALPDDDPAPTALDGVCAVFRLSPFERDLLLLCAGVELDAEFGRLCGTAQSDPQRLSPTFSLALAALPDAHWSAIAPHAPLRRHRLIEIGAGATLTTSPLRIDERILHCLVGVSEIDERLRGLIDPVIKEGTLVPSHQALAERIATIWRQGSAESPVFQEIPIFQLCGLGRRDKRQIAAEACRLVGLGLGALSGEALPTGQTEMDLLIEVWNREVALTRSALLVEADEIDGGDSARATALARLLDRLHGRVLVSTTQRHPMRQRPIVTLEVTNPTLSEQRSLWSLSLGMLAGPALGASIEQIVTQFDIPGLTIRAASTEALGSLASGPERPEEEQMAALKQTLWEACRVSARPRLDDLAQRIVPAAEWADLVLPETQRATLHDIAAHVRRRSTVYYRWEFAAQGSRGLGISALFAGASGTGKTLAAEVLARELDLDLYRIDLSAVVSKYIGESEKNLRRVFDAAEAGGAILLFDEADALFGKRTEIKDSHDRYANQEVAYLLQRMEAYRGLAILTTNLKSSLDAAFLRRLRYVVAFPFPDAAQRAEIWRRVFPGAAPTEGLVPGTLAQMLVSGGNIRNIALNAAFLAADAEEPIQMRHILRASQAEYAKLERTLTDAEVAGWL